MKRKKTLEQERRCCEKNNKIKSRAAESLSVYLSVCLFVCFALLFSFCYKIVYWTPKILQKKPSSRNGCCFGKKGRKKGYGDRHCLFVCFVGFLVWPTKWMKKPWSRNGCCCSKKSREKGDRERHCFPNHCRGSKLSEHFFYT